MLNEMINKAKIVIFIFFMSNPPQELSYYSYNRRFMLLGLEVFFPATDA